MRIRPLASALGAGAVVLLLAGCVPNAPAGGAITVSSTEDACTVSANSATSGTLTFDVMNDGNRVTEFYVLADDGLRIVGEVENIAPGESRTLSVVAQPGSYFTVCKPGMIGAGIGQAAFTVSGDTVEVAADEQAAHTEAVTNYTSYVRNQVAELVPAVDEFVAAYVAGDDEKARSLYASSRLYYERIEPTAESFGDLDPRIDYREVDARAEGLDWTGFHRIEKDLWAPEAGDKNSDDTDALQGWAPSTPAQRADFGAKLQADVAELSTLVNGPDFQLQIADITNGAISLLDEVANGKVTGEEDWWSGTDLSDFKGNVEGAQVAFGLVEDLARSKGAEGVALSDTITSEFEALNTELATHGSTETGFVDYKSLTPEQVKALAARVDALAEPLSQLTSTVLDIQST